MTRDIRFAPYVIVRVVFMQLPELVQKSKLTYFNINLVTTTFEFEGEYFVFLTAPGASTTDSVFT